MLTLSAPHASCLRIETGTADLFGAAGGDAA